MKLACLLFAVSTAVALPAAADPQFMTMERADRESRIGLQASFQLYPDLDDVFGLRTELYGQYASGVRGGTGAFGGYAHLALGFLFGDEDSENGVSNIELGGYYIAAIGQASDLVLHVGLSLPTASDDLGGFLTNVLTHVERNYDLVNTLPESTILRFGGTIRTGVGQSGFLQGDLGVDVYIDVPGEDNDPLFHANLGLGTYLGGDVALMGELAAAFANGSVLGSVGISLRLPGAAHPHLGYILAFADDDDDSVVSDDGGIVAHIFSFGFYASL